MSEIKERSLQEKIQEKSNAHSTELLTELEEVLPGYWEKGRRMQDYARWLICFYSSGLKRVDVGDLYLLCNFHDVGKLVDTGIDHCFYGREIASLHHNLKPILNLILLHHESYDGSGYKGLKGRSIPLECRIFRIIEEFDLMVNVNNSHTEQEAIRDIADRSFSAFDPNLVPLCNDVFQKNVNQQMCVEP